jgi:hypothetical protein
MITKPFGGLDESAGTGCRVEWRHGISSIPRLFE